MDMWCLDGIGRGSWDRDMSRIVVRSGPSPPIKGMKPEAVAPPFAGVPRSSPVRIIVVVAARCLTFAVNYM